MYQPESREEEDFLRNYDPTRYERPAVTADVVIFTLNGKDELSLLLIRRGGFPYKGRWALPGGFVDINESVDDAAGRELAEETGLSGIEVHQFGTFGDVGRDPRMRVISVAYMAFVPGESLRFTAGDDAAAAALFAIRDTAEGPVYIGDRTVLKEADLAFDHAEIIRRARQMLKNRIEYTEDAFAFLDDSRFTIFELKRIFEAVTGEPQDTANFRRDFLRKFVKTGRVEETGETSRTASRRPAAVYRRIRDKEPGTSAVKKEES